MWHHCQYSIRFTMQETSKQQNNTRNIAESVSPRTRSRAPRWLALLRGREVMLTVALLAGLFLLLTVIVINGDLRPTWWDVRVTQAIQTLPYTGIGWLLVKVSEPGFAPWNWIMVGAAVLFMVWRRWYVEAAFTLVASLGGLLGDLVKMIIDRPRPTPDLVHITNVLHTYSFPRTHVSNYVSFFGSLFYLCYTLLPRSCLVRKVLLF